MMLCNNKAWLFCFFITLLSCKDKERFTHLQGRAQGTTFSIIYDKKYDFTTSIDSIFHMIDSSMSLWDSTSTISKINANKYDGIVDAHFQKVFMTAMEVSKETNGYFDITVGPLIKAWMGSNNTQSIPSSDQIDSLKKLVGYKKLQLIDGRIVKDNPKISLDFNALAQGYTVDVIASFLESQNVKNYMIEVGGEVRAKGMNEYNKLWQIGIDKPIDNIGNNRPLQTILSLNNRAMATSGSYRKYVMKNGKKYSHAIDPLTGQPITHNLLSITVFAQDCMTADAYATAFLVMGIEKARPLAKKKSLVWYGILSDEHGKLVEMQSQ
jgi:thiamine biosynthesis lipoprotein